MLSQMIKDRRGRVSLRRSFRLSWDGSLFFVALFLFFDFRVAVACGDDLLACGDYSGRLDAAEQVGEAFNRLLFALALGCRVALDADVSVELHPCARRNQA